MTPQAAAVHRRQPDNFRNTRLDTYFQSPPPLRLELVAQYRPCRPMEQIAMHVTTAKNYGMKG